MANKTSNIATQLILQHCCMIFVVRFSVPLATKFPNKGEPCPALHYPYAPRKVHL